MKIINNVSNSTISTFSYGDCFIAEGEVFMLVCTDNNTIPSAVRLADGVMRYFSDDDIVLGVYATVTIE